jgi:hypothetical protein
VTGFNANAATISGDGKNAVIGVAETQLHLSGAVTDVTAPSAYAVAFTTCPINGANETAAAFQMTGAEVGATYNYTISSSGGGTPVTGSGTIATTTQNVTGINVSGLPNGTLTVSLTLTDTSSNTGGAVTNTVVKNTDVTAPSGYAVAFTTSPINAGNQTAAVFQITGAEVGATYNYSISSSGGGTPVTGSGTIATTTQNVTGINVSGLGDGTLTVSLTLTDAASNTGGAVTNTVVKSIDPCNGSPSVGTVCADGTVYAGLSPDGNVPMYVTRCDLGQSWNGTSCTGTRTTPTWNDGTSNWLDTPLANCSASTGTSPPVGTGTCITGRSNSNYLLTADSATTTGGVDPHNAAIACENLVEDGHSDWYLPGLNELYLLYVGRASISGLDTSGNWYWSSSEYHLGNAWLVRFIDGFQLSYGKNLTYYLRCARR